MSFFEGGGSLRLAPALCMVHTVYENALLFLLNIKHGASQLYLAGGGGSNYLAPALATRIGGQGPSLGARVGPC